MSLLAQREQEKERSSGNATKLNGLDTITMFPETKEGDAPPALS